MSDEQDWIERGKALSDPKEKIHHFEEALKINPRNLEATYLIADTYMHPGGLFTYKDLLVAIEWFKKTIDIDPDFGPAWRNMAEALIETQKKEEALNAINESLRINGENPTDLNTRSRIYWFMRDYKKAYRDAKDGLELLESGKFDVSKEVNYGLWFQVGWFHERNGKKKEAWNAFRAALPYIYHPHDADHVNSRLDQLKKDMKKYIEDEIEKLREFLKEVENTQIDPYKISDRWG
ncbi:MAG: tetratricopeptide repeat protein [Candidatus Helarchaeota archaeon]|nr:tetratricopeptide repeat protein [Candidatus Helarchaeota archaeon]